MMMCLVLMLLYGAAEHLSLTAKSFSSSHYSAAKVNDNDYNSAWGSALTDSQLAQWGIHSRYVGLECTELNSFVCGIRAFEVWGLTPECHITAPADQQHFSFGDVIDIQVAGEAIEQVSFYIDDKLEHIDDSAPYRYHWDSIRNTLGRREIKAVATDRFGTTAVDTIQVTIDLDEVKQYSYQVINSYPHDPKAFTQGLIYVAGQMYESTGLTQGRSSLRTVDYRTGEVAKKINLANHYFGEGIALFNDKIYQLTWQNKLCLVYEQDSFNKIDEYSYNTEGWGLTHDNESFIMSDGSAYLYFRDLNTFKAIKKVQVTEQLKPVNNLNELEFFYHKIFANIWQTDDIVMIDKASGQIIGRIHLAGLLDSSAYPQADVLNGIAYDSDNDRIFVTGKFWPFLYELKLVPLN